MWWNHGWAGGGWWWAAVAIWALFWIAVIGGTIWFIVWLARRPQGPGPSGVYHETALDILNKRYARGEITREEYERMKQDLQ